MHVGMRGLADQLQRGGQRGNERRVARELDHRGHLVLHSRVAALANAFDSALVIVRGDLAAGDGGTVDLGKPERRELLAALLPGIEPRSPVRVWNPKIRNYSRAGDRG